MDTKEEEGEVEMSSHWLALAVGFAFVCIAISAILEFIDSRSDGRPFDWGLTEWCDKTPKD